jgi:16S rRNA (guanine527-N7)-methyltransferase
LSAPDEPAPELDDRGRVAVEAIVELLAADPAAPTSVSDRERARQVHVADSLSGLIFAELRDAERICDIGAGAGFPGLVLAAALPRARLELVESSRRKCEFIARAAAAAGLENVTVRAERAETFAAGAGAGRFEAVTARAVGRLSTLAELASPLLVAGGVLVAWKGRRDRGEEAELDRAAEQLAMHPEAVRWVGPYAGSENRHLHLIRKRGATPAGLPRRPGMAKKRPRGAV